VRSRCGMRRIDHSSSASSAVVTPSISKEDVEAGVRSQQSVRKKGGNASSSNVRACSTSTTIRLSYLFLIISKNFHHPRFFFPIIFSTSQLLNFSLPLMGILSLFRSKVLMAMVLYIYNGDEKVLLSQVPGTLIRLFSLSSLSSLLDRC